MYNSVNFNSTNSKELESVKNLMKNNVDHTKDIIKQIDNFLESKPLPKSVLDMLVNQRNAYAVNVMNFMKVMKMI
ncbi:hypothetical protein [Aquimarina litoralis]|uniref:hypothetical protein n=1 Tax=Aquimarina litoralis TaxID=584605 RepID=UPI001C585066|nr:hypothetical protein [Aquimarina litoralis]MBW1295572.1 hypothetical protein [Aquimarina litoralis]